MPAEPLTLATICGGAAFEVFQRELAEVLENIADVNTKTNKVRKIGNLIRVCEFYEAPGDADDCTGYPGSDGVETCWRRQARSVEPFDICGPCAAHGDRRNVRRTAMAKREGAKRRLRRIAAQIEALQEAPCAE